MIWESYNLNFLKKMCFRFIYVLQIIYFKYAKYAIFTNFSIWVPLSSSVLDVDNAYVRVIGCSILYFLYMHLVSLLPFHFWTIIFYLCTQNSITIIFVPATIASLYPFFGNEAAHHEFGLGPTYNLDISEIVL